MRKMGRSEARVIGSVEPDLISLNEAHDHDVLESPGVDCWYIKLPTQWMGANEVNIIEIPKSRFHDRPESAYRACKATFTNEKKYRRVGSLSRVEIVLHVD